MPGAGSSTGHVGFGWDDCVGCSLSVPMSPCSCVQLCPLGIVTREGVFIYIHKKSVTGDSKLLKTQRFPSQIL